jgi:hypothetical protein
MKLGRKLGKIHTKKNNNKKRNVRVLPRNCPYLNPIEHVWDLLDRRVRAWATPPCKAFLKSDTIGRKLSFNLVFCTCERMKVKYFGKIFLEFRALPFQRMLSRGSPSLKKMSQLFNLVCSYN